MFVTDNISSDDETFVPSSDTMIYTDSALASDAIPLITAANVSRTSELHSSEIAHAYMNPAAAAFSNTQYFNIRDLSGVESTSGFSVSFVVPTLTTEVFSELSLSPGSITVSSPSVACLLPSVHASPFISTSNSLVM